MLGRLQSEILAIIYASSLPIEAASIHRGLTSKHITLGSIYISLDRLTKKGLLQRKTSEPRQFRGGKRRVLYSITERGQYELETTLANDVAVTTSIRPKFEKSLNRVINSLK